MFNRLRKLWKLTKKDQKALEKLESLNDEQITAIPDEPDGKAVFFGTPTEKEFKELEREDKGLKGIFGL